MTKFEIRNNIKSSNSHLRLFFLIIISSFVIGFSSLPASALSDPEAKLSQVLHNYITTRDPSLSGQDVRISFKYAEKLFDSLRNVDDNAEFRVVEVQRDFKPVGNVIFPLEIKEGEQNRKIFLRTKVEVYKDVVVAEKRIKRGDAVSPNDLTRESRDVALLPPSFYTDLDEPAKCEAKTNIPKGSTLFAWMLKEIPVIRRGDSVNIKIIGENLQVASRGKALEDGYLNQKINVRRDGAEAKDIVQGVLINSTEVEVKL